MSKLRETIRDEWRRRQRPARGPLVVMTRIVAPVLSGDRIVGSRQTGTRRRRGKGVSQLSQLMSKPDSQWVLILAFGITKILVA
jgi:hypothetical protein